MGDFKNFCLEHKGAIIGGLIAIVVALTGLMKFLVGIVIIMFGVWAGDYIQKNKDSIKEKLKNFIDKL